MNVKLDNAKLGNAKNKTEQAGMMGVKIPENDYWGDYSSKICGSVGGKMVILQKMLLKTIIKSSLRF